MFASDAAAALRSAGAATAAGAAEAATPPSSTDARGSTARYESASYWRQPQLYTRHTASSPREDRLRRCRSVDETFFPVQQPVGARHSLIFLSLLSNQEHTNLPSSASKQRADTETSCSQVKSQVIAGDTTVCNDEDTGIINCQSFNTDSGLQNATSLEPDRTPDAVQSIEDLNSLPTPLRPTDSEEPSDSSMLSSTVMTVAPHFSRRGKRFDGPGSLHSQGRMQDVTNLSRDFQRTQHSMGRMFSNASQDQPRARRSTVDWSNKSGPSSLSYSANSRHHSVPTGVSVKGTENLNKVGYTCSEVRPHSIMSPSGVDQNSTQTAEHRGISSLGSKPTTSSLLLSLRRLNNRNVNGPPQASKIQSPTQSTSPQDDKIYKTHLSYTFNKNVSQERVNPTPASTSTPHRTSEIGSSSNDRISKAAWFSSSTDKATDNALQSMNQTQSRFLASRQAFMEGRPYSSQQERVDLGKEISNSSARDSFLIKTPPLKIITRSETTWKQHDSLPRSLNDTNSQMKQESALVLSNNIHNVSQSGFTNSKRPTDDGRNIKPRFEDKSEEFKSPRQLQNLPDLLLSSKINSTSKLPPAPNMSSSRLENDHRPFQDEAISPAFRKQSLTLDLSSTFVSGPHRAQSTSPFQRSPVSPPRNSPIQSFPVSLSQEKVSKKTTPSTPIGFERSYASIPKPFDSGSKVSHTVDIMSKRLHSTSPFTTKSHHSAPLSPKSALDPPPANTLHLLTPPSTPVPTSPGFSETSSPKEGRDFANSLERNAKKPEKTEQTKEKKKRRVTWEDSVENSKLISDVDASTISPQSPTRSTRGINAPSIFSFLRPNSPTNNSHPVRAPSARTTSLQVETKEKYRSFSSDSADFSSRDEQSRHKRCDSVDLSQARQELTAPRQSVNVQSRSSAALSLPPDFLSGYQVRYSSPPYSTLVSTRSIQDEGKRPPPRSPLFKEQDQPNNTGQNRYVLLHQTEDARPLKSEPRQSTANSCLSQKPASYGDGLNRGSGNDTSRNCRNIPLLLVDNRLQVGPKDKQAPGCVTETLVYSINHTPNDTKPDLLAETFITPVSPQVIRGKATPMDLGTDTSRDRRNSQAEDFNGGAGVPNQKGVTEKNISPSVEENKEQTTKKSRFILKKSSSTPNTNLSRSDSDRSNKTNSKMTVLNKIRQTFSTRRSEDDPAYPWKFKRSSQTPSLSGLSDTSTSSDTAESNKTQHKGKDGPSKDKENVRVRNEGWIQKRYSKPMSLKNTNENNPFSLSLDFGTKGKKDANESRSKVNWTNDISTSPQIEDKNVDIRVRQPPSLVLPDNDTSSNISPSHSQVAKSSCPRSPFSPFPSLSPISPLTPPDTLDDNVFYSPKLRRRKDSLSPREPREGISLGGSSRCRVSTGPPSASSGNVDSLPSSYADLKYGIEPGRSVSVSSVLSSRPSGPGRISTGSRVMSVGDLTAPSLSCKRSSRDLDQWALYPDWTTDCSDSDRTYSHVDASQVRSRSLPRSLTRHLAAWSSDMSEATPAPTTSKAARLWSPSFNVCQFSWDTECPPTPPPTPPLSPPTRRMSKPSSVSLSNSPDSSGDSLDNPTPKGRLPSRGYISSLSSFKESSESSSDTTTDDEYYLESDEEKETEL